MGAPLAVSLDGALRDVRALGWMLGDDPFRLDLPPDAVDDDRLDPQAAAAIGSLYLLSELEQVGVVACAELLARERWNLGVRDAQTASDLETYAAGLASRPGSQLRGQLYSRLFGTPAPDAAPPPTGSRTVPVAPPPGNDVFEELLAGYCDAVAAFDVRLAARTRSGLRLTGDRLRANLAPRQYGNTLVVATPLVEQVRASLDLLGQAAIGDLFHTRGAWGVVRALQPSGGVDIGRHVDRGQSGRVVIASTGYPSVPDLVDSTLRQAAETWLAATGFSATGYAVDQPGA